MIEIRNVSHSYDSKPVLRNISLSITGQRTAIIGTNGSGKTTLVRLLNALILPDLGEVCIAGVSTKDNARAARRNVGLVFQNPDTQIVMPTVAEDLAFGLENLRLPKSEIAREVANWLETYGLGDRRDSPAHLLSGGEKKLLSILSVLIMKPKIIVFDEPFASLDFMNRSRIETLIDTLPQPVITVTHDLNSIAHYDRALLLDKGEVCADGAPGHVVPVYLERMQACFPSISPAIPLSIA